jgi:hypothetical protein
MRLTIPGVILASFIGATPLQVAGQTTTAELVGVGPKVGAAAAEFSLADQQGRVHTLRSILRPNGAMLLFLRSADW